ncbi:MAG: DsbA family protein [Gemmatimonadales bacterium]
MRLLLALGAILLLPGLAGAQAIPLSARTIGSASAPVTVYEMSDFQCPFCRQHALGVFPALEKEYVESGKVKWVFINYPLTSIHPNAVAAASFAMCSARHDRFWPAHELLFRHQELWAPLQNPAPFLLTLVDSLSLPREAMNSCLSKGETVTQIQSDADRAAQSGARSTPTFYIEGGLMVGVKPLPFFRQVLDSVYTAKTRSGR